MENNNSKNIRTFALTNWALNNKYTVYVVIFLVFIMGLMAYTSMPREDFPDIVVPRIFIGTAYPGNTPIDIERLITKPMEKEINAISGINKLTSSSMNGYSSIDVEFNFSISMEEALRKVKDKIDIAKSSVDFPKDLPADPSIIEFNISELSPIMNINLSGDFNLDGLKAYAEILEDEIETLPEIKEVDIRGIDQKEIEIKLNLYMMESAQISFDDIESAIARENITVSGGDILNNGVRTSIRVIGELKTIEQFENIIVKRENQEVVFLKDISVIKFKEKEKETYSREYGKPVVTLDVKKKAGENLIEASQKIKNILEKNKLVFPDNLKITISSDMSDNVKNQVKDLEDSIILGVILVVLVLMFFLGFRNSLFVGIAIPLSMLMSFLILGYMGITLNTMVLFALVIALGMIVDNGIVVTENIFSLLQKGYSLSRATKEGVGEVAWPIISSTATTLAAFLPLAMWPGMIGEFMKYLPLTLIIVLSSSLFVALFITPVLVNLLMSTKEEEKPSFDKNKKRMFIILFIGIIFSVLGFLGKMVFLRILGNIGIYTFALWFIYVKWFYDIIIWFQYKFMSKLEDLYQDILIFCIEGRRAYRTFWISILAFIMSFVMFGIFPPNVLFFPESEPEQIMIYIEYPNGTDIEETNSFTKSIEDKVYGYLSKYEIREKTKNQNDTVYNFLVKSVIAQVGEGTSNSSDGNERGIPHKAKISISFVETEYRRGVNTFDIMKDLRKEIGQYPGVLVQIDKNQEGPPVEAPVNIEIAGEDYKEIFRTAMELKSFIAEQKDIKGIENLKPSVNIDKPEMDIHIDRERARMYNISTSQIATAIRTSLYGKEISRYKIDTDDDSYPINIRLEDSYRYDIGALLNQKITFRDNQGKISQVPISSVVYIDNSSSFSAVKRKKMQRMVILSSNVLEGYNPNNVVAKLKERIKKFDYDTKNLTIKFTGEQEEQGKEMAFLGGALMMAVFLIFLIIVMQFNSIYIPLIILSAVLLSFMGVFYGLVITGMDFVIIMTMIGIVSLAGVVVNNAIVLVDYTNLLMDRKKEELQIEYNLSKEDIYSCIIAAGKSRLRPVLLTAITTILGLVPMAIGMNMDFYGLLLNFNPGIYFGGDNASFWGPMAWTIIFGLTVATFLTLVVVPNTYFLLLRVKIRYRREKVKV